MSKIEQNKYHVDINTEFEEQKSDKQVYLLRKITDDYFNGVHPNGIDEGHVTIGVPTKPPTVGERFEIRGNRLHEYLLTSVVREIIDDEVFKTEYSTYKLIKYENNKK